MRDALHVLFLIRIDQDELASHYLVRKMDGALRSSHMEDSRQTIRSTAIVVRKIPL